MPLLRHHRRKNNKKLSHYGVTLHANPTQQANGIGLRLDDVNFERVLVPVDFPVCTLETLRYAKALAKEFDAVVDVLHVIQNSLCPVLAVRAGMTDSGANHNSRNGSSFETEFSFG
jgi:hypothetical protein